MLKFNSDGKFKILLFGDIHENCDYEVSLKFKDMQKLMNAALDEYKPDLCVLLGDNCENYAEEAPELFGNMFRAVTEPITSRKIPFAAIMGNHEHDKNNAEKVVEIYQKVDGCLTRNDTPEEITGDANFTELIFSSDGEKPLFNLWFIDSNNLYEDRDVSHYDYVHQDQIKWFDKKSAELKELNGGKPMPSFVFQHIPVPEEYRLLRKAKPWEIAISRKGYNSMRDTLYVLKEGGEGYFGEGPCSPDCNSGQFESWKQAGGVLGAFFGHDHLNDFSGFVDGIFLAQHKTAGFRAYTDGCRSCVRCVTLDENDLSTFTHELKHFKEFGLKSESLGPIYRNITDRQSLIMHICANVAGGIAIAAGTGFAINKIIKAIGGKNNG